MVVKTFAIHVLAGQGELGGTYCHWRWLREHRAWQLAVLGVTALFGYAVVQTHQPESRYARVYEAYAGIFLVGAMLWGWLVDDTVPDRFDVIGAAITMLGVVVLFGREVLAQDRR